MVEKKTIQLSGICREALASRAPGEDLDEALLRAVKKLYPEEGLKVFATVEEVLKLREKVQGKPREELVSILSQGQDVFEITQTTFATTEEKGLNFKFGADLSTMPPEIKALVDEALAKGKVVSTTATTENKGLNFNFGADLSTMPSEIKALVDEALAKGKVVSATTSEQTQMVSEPGAVPPSLDPPAGSPPDDLPPSRPIAVKPRESGLDKFLGWFKTTFLGGPD